MLLKIAFEFQNWNFVFIAFSFYFWFFFKCIHAWGREVEKQIDTLKEVEQQRDTQKQRELPTIDWLLEWND